MVLSEWELTNEQRASIEKVRDLIGAEAFAQKYCTPFNVLRWINAYGNAEEAAPKLKRHLTIRRIKQLDFLEEQFEDFDEIASIYCPVNIVGQNRKDDNKVLIFEPAGRIDIQGVIGTVQTTPFMKNRFRIMERILRRINEMEEQSKRISGGVLVVDLDGLQLQTSLINILRGPYRIMWGTLLEQYPGIFSQIIVVNVPKFMNVLWSACAAFISEEYREKIVVTSDNWRTEILKYLDTDCLPAFYGGTLRDKQGDEQCRSLITIPPPHPFPNFKQFFPVLLDSLSIPAGGKLVQVYHFEKGKQIEFFMHHDQEFTMVVLYSSEINEDALAEEELEEVYAGCERPALATVDHWKWTVPYTGHYYIRYGNEKAWFMSVSVKYQINICQSEGKRKAKPIKQF